MITVTEMKKRMAHRKAVNTLAALDSDRKIEEKMSMLERSTDMLERLSAIQMRSILNGDTEASFAKACKVYTKTTKEKLRFA